MAKGQILGGGDYSGGSELKLVQILNNWTPDVQDNPSYWTQDVDVIGINPDNTNILFSAVSANTTDWSAEQIKNYNKLYSILTSGVAAVEKDKIRFKVFKQIDSTINVYVLMGIDLGLESGGGSSAVTSVNHKTGDVVLTLDDLTHALQQNVNAGVGTVIFNDVNLSQDSTIDIYCTNPKLYITDQVLTAGKLTLTIKPMTENITIKVRIS